MRTNEIAWLREPARYMQSHCLTHAWSCRVIASLRHAVATGQHSKHRAALAVDRAKNEHGACAKAAHGGGVGQIGWCSELSPSLALVTRSTWQ